MHRHARARRTTVAVRTHRPDPGDRTSLPGRAGDRSALAEIRDELERSDPGLAGAFARLTDAPLRAWWTRPLTWWVATPLFAAAFVVALRLVGLAAFAGLAVLAIAAGLALVSAHPTDDDMSTPRHGSVSRSRGADRRRRRDI